jgi:hypothetical protein
MANFGIIRRLWNHNGATGINRTGPDGIFE